MSEENKFYVYVYCNPLKPGNFSYLENGIGIDFPCAPFHIGKGKELRLEDHLKEAKRYKKLQEIIEEETIQEEKQRYNKHKINTINKIIRLGQEVVIFKICENLNEETSFNLEKFLIKLIGRADLKTGILTNMTDGGEGTSGVSEEVKERRVESYKQTLKDDTSINIKKGEKISESRTNRTESEWEVVIQRYKDKLESDPSINVKRGKNISKAWENKSEEEKIKRNKKLSVIRIENKIGIGSNYHNFYKLDYEMLIKSYFAGICKKDIIEDYNKRVERPLIPPTYNRFLFVLNLPINTLAKGHPHKRDIYLEFIKENKYKIQWYIDNYEKLEEEWFERKWEEKHKEFFDTNNNIEVEHE